MIKEHCKKFLKYQVGGLINNRIVFAAGCTKCSFAIMRNKSYRKDPFYKKILTDFFGTSAHEEIFEICSEEIDHLFEDGYNMFGFALGLRYGCTFNKLVFLKSDLNFLMHTKF